MKQYSKYRVRVMADDSKCSSIWNDGLSYDEAVERFVFFVRCALELGAHIKVVNIFKGKKCVKMFVNHE